MSTGKVIKAHAIGEQHRIDICPANYCVAMSGSLSDKTIHIVDLDSGKKLAHGTGHGEVITAIKFTPACRRLVSASSDGCIFVWRLAEELQSAIKARLQHVTELSRWVRSPHLLCERHRFVFTARHLWCYCCVGSLVQNTVFNVFNVFDLRKALLRIFNC
jgi:WD40 repeat protein